MIGIYGDVYQELTALGKENDALNEQFDELLMVILELDAELNCPMCSKSNNSEDHDKNCRIHSIATNYKLSHERAR
jgi:hypothetical protein